MNLVKILKKNARAFSEFDVFLCVQIKTSQIITTSIGEKMSIFAAIATLFLTLALTGRADQIVFTVYDSSLTCGGKEASTYLFTEGECVRDPIVPDQYLIFYASAGHCGSGNQFTVVSESYVSPTCNDTFPGQSYLCSDAYIACSACPVSLATSNGNFSATMSLRINATQSVDLSSYPFPCCTSAQEQCYSQFLQSACNSSSACEWCEQSNSGHQCAPKASSCLLMGTGGWFTYPTCDTLPDFLAVSECQSRTYSGNTTCLATPTANGNSCLWCRTSTNPGPEDQDHSMTCEYSPDIPYTLNLQDGVVQFNVRTCPTVLQNYDTATTSIHGISSSSTGILHISQAARYVLPNTVTLIVFAATIATTALLFNN